MRLSVRSLGWGAAAVLAVSALATMTPSARLRSSLSAAHRAFHDPTLVEPRQLTTSSARAPDPPTPPLAARAPLVPEADVDTALDGAEADDLDDPQSPLLGALTLPDLRISVTRRTLRYVRYFARTEPGRRVFEGCYRRFTRHHDMIEDALRAAGLPLDLAWLPAIESGYDPKALSPAGALGLWQLMPETARAQGLSRTTWIDERLDPALSTRAAVKLLADLHRRFKRWDLALAAYNAGSGRVQSALDRWTGGHAPTFADLAAGGALPEETAAYVPQVTAFALVAINAEIFSLDLPDSVAAPEPGFLVVPEGTRLDTIARAAGLDVAVLREHNPALLGDRVPPRGGVYRVLLPQNRVEEARRALPAGRDHEVVLSDEPEADNPPLLDDAGAPEPAPMAAPEPPEPPFFTALPEPAASQEIALVAAPILAPSAPTVVTAKLPPSPALVAPAAAAPKPLPTSVPVVKPEAKVVVPPEPAATPDLPERPAEPADPMRALELQNGIVVRARRDPEAAKVTLTTRFAMLGDGAVESTSTLQVGNRDLVAGMELCAARLRAALGDPAGADVLELRRRAGAARRKVLEKAAYGRAWLVLGEALFPPRHPLAGTVLGAAADAASLRDLLVADLLVRERASARASLTVAGDVDEGYVHRLATALLGSIPAREGPDKLPRGPDRSFVEAPVSEPRALYGWVISAPTVEDDAALRVARALLGGERTARLRRALVDEAGLSLGAEIGLERVSQTTWVFTIEVSIAPAHTINEVEKALEDELARLAAEGPGAVDLGEAVTLARALLDEDLEAADKVNEPIGGPSSALAASLRRALDGGREAEVRRMIATITGASMGRVIRRYLGADRRTVVITTPSSRGVDHRVAARSDRRGAAAPED